MKASGILIAAAGAVVASGPAQAQSKPSIELCLRAYDSEAQQARYRVTIRWNDMGGSGFHRIDIAASDAGQDVWLQLRDQRLRPRSRPTQEFFTVSDVTRYPLQIFLVGLTREAAERFDRSCRDGFCSLRLPREGVTELNEGVSVSEPRRLNACA